MTLRTLNYGNYGIFLIMGNAGFCPSTVSNALNLRVSAFTLGRSRGFKGQGFLGLGFKDNRSRIPGSKGQGHELSGFRVQLKR